MKRAAVVVLVLAFAVAGGGALRGAAVAVAVLAGLYVAWRVSLRLHPYRPCWWCKGSGKNWWSNKRRWGTCWFCHGRPQYRRGAQRPQ